ncbi:MAG: hypothetical protein ACQETB_06965 [Halobacteriota archaeon]
MTADVDGDHPPDGNGGQTIATKISTRSDRLRERIGRVMPDSTTRLKQSFKLAFSIALTVLLGYWVLAYQYDVVWFEF